MVFLRATQKVLRHLPPVDPEEAQPDTALGDWYVTRRTVDRVPLLLMVSSRSLLPILVRAQEVRKLPERLPDMVRARLRRIGIEASWVEAEVAAMCPVRVAKTADRSVLGILTDFSKLLPLIFPDSWTDGDLYEVEDRLGETPCYASRSYEETIFPLDKAPELLRGKWGSI